MPFLPALLTKKRRFRLLPLTAYLHKGVVMLCFCIGTVGVSCKTSINSGNNGNSSQDKGSSTAASFNYTDIKTRRICFLTGMDKADSGFADAETIRSFTSKQDKQAEKALQVFGGYEGIAAYSPAGKHIEEVYADFNRVLILAKTYRTEGSAFYQKPELAAAVNTLLRLLHTGIYHKDQAEHTNWWHWEIGFPLKILDTLLLLDETADAALRDSLVAATRYFQPDALYSGNNPGAIHPSGQPKRLSTGANRVDLVKLCVLRGILTGNASEIRDALAALAPVWETKTGTEAGEARDGFYADGSFIQHCDIPYTGTYGVVLIGGIGELLYLIGTAEPAAAIPHIDRLYVHLFAAFEPLLYKGCMPDFVSGRAISRKNSWDGVNGQAALDALVLLGKGAAAPYAQQIQALIKRELQNSSLLSNGTYAPAQDALFYRAAFAHAAVDSTAALPYTAQLYGFSAMERYFFRSQKYAIGLALHSNKIGNYETMNGENTSGWYTGDGMVYIYDRSDNYRYFWHDADLRYIPGTTEVAANMEGKNAQRKGNKPATGQPSEYNATAKTVRMDFHNWNDTLQSVKEWTFIPNGLRYSETGISGSGAVQSVVEHKQVFDTQRIMVNGSPFQFIEGDHAVPALQQLSVDGRTYTIHTPKSSVLRCYRKNGRNYLLAFATIGTNPQNETFAWTLMLQ